MRADGYAIRARFEAESTPQELIKWLDSPERISGWWSDTVAGDAGKVGDTFTVRFPSTPVLFELGVSQSDDHVVEWEVPESPLWWKGTTIRFEVSPGEEGGSNLLFSHEGFEPDDPIIAVITPAWVRFLDNLVEVARTGRPSRRLSTSGDLPNILKADAATHRSPPGRPARRSRTHGGCDQRALPPTLP